MNTAELSDFISLKAEQVSEMVNSANVRIWGMGFAIPIPKDTDEEIKLAIDRKLVELMWNFERVRIKGEDHYVLFPI